MVSYYNSSAVAMLTGSGRGHYHHPHPPTPQNPYFPSGAGNPYGPYHPHGHTHQQSSGGSPLGVGMSVGLGISGVSSSQFSPSTDINCNHAQYPHPHPHQFNTMMTAEGWHHHQTYNGACVRGYEEWNNHPMHHMGASAHHPSFYHHTQPSPPSSTPSPHNHLSITAAPTSSATPQSPHQFPGNSSNNAASNNNTGGTTPPFKTEFGPSSGGGNQQETSEHGTQGQVVVSSASGPIPTPHSPDSGMAISDGVSSSGSPATGLGQQYGQTQPQQCLGGPSSSGAGSSASMSSTSSSEMQIHLQGSHYNLSHHHMSSPLINVTSGGRPTQARSPYEWMKKPAYHSNTPSSSSNNAKTRTKDKYRVVYSDTQRLELEKEFHYSRYITIRRKSELAVALGLSERQVKIWFQNRRAKERKIQRKTNEMMGRDKLASMVHMQNSMMGPNGICNQSIPLM